LSSFKKHLSEMLFFRYFPPKNSSIEQLFNDFLKKTSEKIAISYKHFLKKDKSIYKKEEFSSNKLTKFKLDFSHWSLVFSTLMLGLGIR